MNKMVRVDDVISSIVAAVCASIPCIIIAACVFPSGALIRHQVMNGYKSALGTVTDSHWEVVRTDGGDYYDPIIHYNYLGKVDVQYVNGTSMYYFIGGHSCRGHGIAQKDKVSAQQYLRKYGAIGATHPLLYKPPDYFHCTFDEERLSHNYKTALAFFGIAVLVWLYGCFGPCIFHNATNDDPMNGCVMIIFCPITLPLYLCHWALSNSTIYVAPPPENHPLNGPFSRLSSRLSSKISMVCLCLILNPRI